MKLYISLAGSSDPKDEALRRYVWINGSRFDLLDENRPFVGTEPMAPGRALYPQGLTRAEVEAYVAAHPDDENTQLITYFAREAARGGQSGRTHEIQRLIATKEPTPEQLEVGDLGGHDGDVVLVEVVLGVRVLLTVHPGIQAEGLLAGSEVRREVGQRHLDDIALLHELRHGSSSGGTVSTRVSGPSAERGRPGSPHLGTRPSHLVYQARFLLMSKPPSQRKWSTASGNSLSSRTFQ